MCTKSRKRAFTLVEIIASIAIIAALIAILIPSISNFFEVSKQTADRQTLAVLNDALNRYKMQGGDLSLLTSDAMVADVITQLKTPITWHGVTHQFLNNKTDVDIYSLRVAGSGQSYRFTAIGSYEEEAGGSLKVHDPAASDYFARAEGLGGSFDQTAISPTYTATYVKQAISDFISGCKFDGVWSKLVEVYLLAGVDFTGLPAKLKYSSTATFTNNGFTPADYLAVGSGAGLTGNGSSKWALLNCDPTTTDPDNRSMGTYITVGGSSTALSLGGGSAGTNGRFQHFGSGFRAPEASASYFGVGDHFLIVSRRGVNDVEAYLEGVSAQTDVVSPAADQSDDGGWVLFRRASNLSAEYGSHTMSLAFIGTGLSDADALALSNRTNALMTALGCNVY